MCNLFKCFVYELHRAIVYFEEKIQVKKEQLITPLTTSESYCEAAQH